MDSGSSTESNSGQDRQQNWHAMSPDEVAEQLQTSSDGLSTSEAESRRERYGPNTLEESEQQSALALLLNQFRSPLIYILVVAAVATLFVQEFIDTAVIAAVLLLNAIIGFTQERKAEKSVAALRQLVSPKARVIRDGRESEVESSDLVPGDVVRLESGSRVPADIRVSDANSLMADESLLTGESAPVQKTTDTVAEDTEVADRSNMMFAGTTITSGRGMGYVVTTGDATELGEIAEQVRGHEVIQTPLQARMDRFAKIVGLAVLVSTVFAVILGIATGVSATDMFMVGVGLAVAAVPEGLPIVFTVTLAVSVHRMAQRNAIIRRLPAVETLGSATVIGSDKTGTLTENRMTVQEVWTADQAFSFDQNSDDASDSVTHDEPDPESQPALGEAVLAGILANESSLGSDDDEDEEEGDPTEIALLVLAQNVGIDPESTRRSYQTIAQTPFEPELRYSASLRDMDGTSRLYVKGAPERILEMSSSMYDNGEIVDLDYDRLEEEISQLASRGLRVLAAASRDFDANQVSDGELPEPDDLSFAGFYGLLDPPREGVREAIEGCQGAGIRVIMITGDHASTAEAIAHDLGIEASDEGAITGSDIEQLSDKDLSSEIGRATVFARVSPEHKLRIVEAFREKGDVVAITGDGVNDAPALKAADIGIAMGKGGTDVAREAADMVLADDNFVSIYGAVEQGRVTFDNVRKVTFFLISTGISATITILAALLLQWPIPFVPAQLLWLNLVTNGLQDVALAMEPGEPDVLKRKPRDRAEGIISRLLWERSILAALLISTGTLVMFWWELNRSDSLVQAQSVALTTMVMFQMFHVANARSEHRSVFQINPFSNRYLLLAVVLAFAVHVGALYFSPAQFVLRVEPISLDAWLTILPMALSVVAVVEAHKFLRPRSTDE